MKNIALYIVASMVILLIAGWFRFKRKPKKLKSTFYVTKWRSLQKLCADRKNWPDAVRQADFLLDTALKKKRFKGKTMGARLMAAQRQISDNDGIWAAHNLAKKIAEQTKAKKAIKLTKTEVKESLESFQASLTDLGALRRAPEKE